MKHMWKALALAAASGFSLPAHAALTIAAAPGANVSCAGQVCTATASDAVLNLKTLKAMLRQGDVTVVSGSLANDIVLADALSWTGAQMLTLASHRSILIARPLSVQGAGGLTLTTNDGGAGGELSFPGAGKATFLDLSSTLVIDGHTYTLVGDIATLAADLAANSYGGYYALAADYDAGPDGTYTRAPLANVHGALEGLGNAISNFTFYAGDQSTSAGLIDDFDGTVRNLALPNVKMTGSGQGGALGKTNYGTVSRVWSSGTIALGFGGGLLGNNGYNGTLEFSHSTASVTGYGSNGGLVGENNGTIVQSFATGSVLSGGAAGGFAGSNLGAVTDCYSLGDVSGSAVPLGGFSGDNSGGAISRAYETGTVSGSKIGGFLGGNGGTVASGYWDSTTTGLVHHRDATATQVKAKGIAPLSSAKLRAALPAGFDPAIWGRDRKINGGFPYLLANPPQ
jgi:hypothetical protein